MPARLRPRLRKFTSTLTFAVLLPIIISPIGQFLIEIGQEQGLYKQPSERVGFVMSALSGFVNQLWVLIAAAFLCGLTAGLWVDYLLRISERRRLVSTSAVKVDADLSAPFGLRGWDQPLEKHFRVRFQNETVLLDGHEFIDCHFENVTFKFDGTKPFRFTGKNKGNSRKVTTDNKIVGQTLTLALVLRPDLGLDYEVHKNGTRLSQKTAAKSNGASDIASSSN